MFILGHTHLWYTNDFDNNNNHNDNNNNNCIDNNIVLYFIESKTYFFSSHIDASDHGGIYN